MIAFGKIADMGMVKLDALILLQIIVIIEKDGEMITQKKHAETVPNLVDFVNIANIGKALLIDSTDNAT